MQFSNHSGRAQRGGIVYLAVDAIAPSAVQPRQNFPPAQLEELSRSIAEYGVLSPLTVRPRPDGYELVAGERRLRAARMAGSVRCRASSWSSIWRRRASSRWWKTSSATTSISLRNRAASRSSSGSSGSVRRSARGGWASRSRPWRISSACWRLPGGCAQRHAQRRAHRAARACAAAARDAGASSARRWPTSSAAT